MKKKFFSTFAISILIFSLAYTFFGDSIFQKINFASSIDEESYEDENNEENPHEDKVEKIKPKDKDELLFVLLGIDTYDIKKAGNERTDTIILSSVNFKSGDIKMLSIPRDTRVPLRDKLDKINHAHAFGGVDLTLQTIRDFLNIDVEHYVKLDYRAVEEIVEAIGGVEIDVPRRMKYDDTHKGKEFHVDLHPGIQTLDGDQAIQFLRWRKNNDGSQYPEGDVGRIKAQQYFMKEIVKQTLRPKNIFKLPRLAKTYYNYIDTNIPLTTVLRGVGIANKIDLDNMITDTIPGEGEYIGGISYYIHYPNQTREVIEEMYGNFITKE